MSVAIALGQPVAFMSADTGPPLPDGPAADAITTKPLLGMINGKIEIELDD